MSKEEIPESGPSVIEPDWGEELLWEGIGEPIGSIEERFLSSQADAFARSEREEKASARSARNDSFDLIVGKEEARI